MDMAGLAPAADLVRGLAPAAHAGPTGAMSAPPSSRFWRKPRPTATGSSRPSRRSHQVHGGPSPGSVYPTLQQLVDKELIAPVGDGRRTEFALTDLRTGSTWLTTPRSSGPRLEHQHRRNPDPRSTRVSKSSWASSTSSGSRQPMNSVLPRWRRSMKPAAPFIKSSRTKGTYFAATARNRMGSSSNSSGPCGPSPSRSRESPAHGVLMRAVPVNHPAGEHVAALALVLGRSAGWPKSEHVKPHSRPLVLVGAEAAVGLAGSASTPAPARSPPGTRRRWSS